MFDSDPFTKPPKPRTWLERIGAYWKRSLVFGVTVGTAKAWAVPHIDLWSRFDAFAWVRDGFIGFIVAIVYCVLFVNPFRVRFRLPRDPETDDGLGVWFWVLGATGLGVGCVTFVVPRCAGHAEVDAPALGGSWRGEVEGCSPESPLSHADLHFAKHWVRVIPGDQTKRRLLVFSRKSASNEPIILDASACPRLDVDMGRTAFNVNEASLYDGSVDAVCEVPGGGRLSLKVEFRNCS